MIVIDKKLHNLKATVFLPNKFLAVAIFLFILAILVLLIAALDILAISTQFLLLRSSVPIASLLTSILFHTLVLSFTLSLFFNGHQLYCLFDALIYICNYLKNRILCFYILILCVKQIKFLI